MPTSYQICTRCVMDTSDPDIRFDDGGVCNHCKDYLRKLPVFVPENPERELARVVDEMKRAGRRHEYDCVIGVSGGVDSSYLAIKARELGLRPLAVHLDNGWNAELAVGNIKKLLDKLQIDLVTVVLDWQEFRDLQLAFLRASTPDSEIPTDHAILASLLATCRKRRIGYMISGVNYRTEGIHVRAWSQGHVDARYLRSVYRRLTTRRLKHFPLIGVLQLTRNILLHTPRNVYLLNYLPYDKAAAKERLQREFGWVDYGGKHFESIYTRFYQGHLLPAKFGYDKRRMHLATLICSGQMDRDEALRVLAQPPYDPELVRRDKIFVAKKLGISVAELEAIIAAPPKRYEDYPNLQNHPLMGPALNVYRRLKYRKVRHA